MAHPGAQCAARPASEGVQAEELSAHVCGRCAHVQQLVAKGQKPRYEQLRSGDMPRGVNYNWEKACDVKNSMYRVEVDMVTSHILECDANPHNFKCGK